MKVIAFTGMPCSGKTEAVKVAKQMGLPVIRMGDLVWEEVKDRDLELTNENVGDIANKMRDKHGLEIWAKRTLEKIRQMEKTDVLVIDGIRNIEEIEFFEEELEEKFILIAIEASDEIRHKRAMKRGRKDDAKNLEKIKDRDKREQGWGIEEVITAADTVVYNEEGIKQFRDEIREIIEGLKDS
ncbi:MAG: AAA family ATPase [Candidatus Thermoplasmatota archaeon]